MGGLDDHSKPELSTLLESGTFYCALTTLIRVGQACSLRPIFNRPAHLLSVTSFPVGLVSLDYRTGSSGCKIFWYREASEAPSSYGKSPCTCRHLLNAPHLGSTASDHVQPYARLNCVRSCGLTANLNVTLIAGQEPIPWRPVAGRFVPQPNMGQRITGCKHEKVAGG